MRTATKAAVAAAINDEVLASDARHGPAEDDQHSLRGWIRIIEDEFDEVFEAQYAREGHCLKQVRHLAARCAKCMEIYGVGDP